MKWVRDTTGRFQKRPHYLPEELDAECEKIVTDFLVQKHGEAIFPISTNDLTCLLETDIESLDLYAEFSDKEGQVEGVTEFRLGKRPVVKIAARLTETPQLENRLRTTLTHEYGHVRFHDFLYQVKEKTISLFEPQNDIAQQANQCKRDSMIPFDDRDWMEWQAGFVCGAMLIPISRLLELVRTSRQRLNMEHAIIPHQSAEGLQIIEDVAQTFQTSKDAARVRLLQKGILSSGVSRGLL
jgi:hypothetical protein